MRVDEHRCDRCAKRLGAHRGLDLIAQYHHPRTIELCDECEGAFAIWLGKHPHSGVPLQDMIAGRATGQGYPTRAQIDAHLETTRHA